MLGVPGSGKSYFGSRLAEETGAAWLSSDKIRTEMYGNERDKITDSKLRYDAVFENMNQQMQQLLGSGKDVIYDANNHKREFRDNFRLAAGNLGAVAILLHIVVPESVSDERAKHRTHSPFQNPTMSDEKIMKHKNLIEFPEFDEPTVTVDGTLPFSDQFKSFVKQRDYLINEKEL